MKIKHPDWAQWEEVILSEQMSAAAINAMMLENHDFANWFRDRARQRLSGRRPDEN